MQSYFSAKIYHIYKAKTLAADVIVMPPKQIGGSLNYLGMVVLYPQESVKGVSVGGSPQGLGPKIINAIFTLLKGLI